MTRSSPPPSPIVARVRESSTSFATIPRPPRSFRRRFNIRLAAWMRWLHIYLSMFGLAAVLFFGVTGVTLNHPTWFFDGAGSQVESQGTIDKKWLRREGADPEASVARLEVVEFLRSAHGIHGALSDFSVDEQECVVSFKGPGYAADAFIDRDAGRYELTETRHGFVAVLNDLHKGRDSGPVWSLVIDISAIVMTIIALTGLVLLFYLKLRRVPGLIVAVLGTVAIVAVVLLGVP